MELSKDEQRLIVTLARELYLAKVNNAGWLTLDALWKELDDLMMQIGHRPRR